MAVRGRDLAVFVWRDSRAFGGGEMDCWRGVVKGVFCELVCCVGVAFAWGRAVGSAGSFASGDCVACLIAQGGRVLEIARACAGGVCREARS